MLDEITDETTQSIRNARLQQSVVSISQRLILDGVLERLEPLNALTVMEISPVWYKVEHLGMKIQLEVRNPGGYLDIVGIPFDDGALSFPRKSWNSEAVKLQTGSEDSIVRKIVSKFTILRDEY
jgi:hypothetical protein